MRGEKKSTTYCRGSGCRLLWGVLRCLKKVFNSEEEGFRIASSIIDDLGSGWSHFVLRGAFLWWSKHMVQTGNRELQVLVLQRAQHLFVLSCF